MEFQALIDELSTICTQVTSEDYADIKQLDNKKVWLTILDVGMNDIRRTSMLYPMINVYATRFPNFRKESEAVENYCQNFLDSSKKFEERAEKSPAIFRWIQFMPETLLQKVIRSAIELTDHYIDENHDAPFDFLLPLNDCEISDLTDDCMNDLFSFLHEEITKGEKKAASLCVYAAICEDLGSSKNEAAKFNNEVPELFLKSENEKNLLAGVFFLNFAASFYRDNPEDYPEREIIFELLKPSILHPNQIIRKRALKAYKKLIECQIFLNEDSLDKYLKLFDQFNYNKLEYFKVLSTYIFPDDDNDEEEEEEDADLSIIQPIVDFVEKHLNDESNKYVQGLCLDVISDLGYKNSTFIEDLIDHSIIVSSKLIESKEISTYPFISNFLFILMEKFSDFKDQIINLISPMVDALDDQSMGPIKQRIYCASAIAKLIKQGIAADQAPKIISFINKCIDQKDNTIDFQICGVILPMSSFLSEEIANKIFVQFLENVKQAEDIEFLEGWIAVLSKLIKKYQIEEQPLSSIVALIMSGELKIYHNTAPHMIMPPITAPFMLIRSFIKKYPSKSVQICNQFIEWLKYTPFSSVPALLLLIAAGLEVGCINEQLATEFISIISKFISKLDVGDVDELMALCTTLNSVNNFYPEKIKQSASEIFPYLAKFAKYCYSNGIEEEDFIDDELIEAMPAVCDFVFNVYATSDDVEVNPDLLEPLFAMLPFQPEVKEIGDILSHLVTMLEDKERFQTVIVPALKAISDILLMKKNDLDEFGFYENLLKDMRQTLKAYCKGNTSLIDRVTSDFKKNRAKLNRFNVLIR